MKVYYDPITVNCRKVLAGFELAGVPYETVKMDYFGGDHAKPEYVAVNPNASMPALDDDGFVLWESNAMLQYGADKVGASGAYPTDTQTRADINRWHLWESSAWFPACYVYLVENLVKPLTGSQADPAVLEAHGPAFHKLAQILEDRLEGRDWICTDHMTIADVAVAAPMHLHHWQKLPLEKYPNIRAWIARVEAQPCWQKTDVAPLLGLEK